ncbi:MAG: ABC transporter ATP-binding protein [Desulfobulbaceae bacterium]|nr:MAG: ABC transporter ATP-binding protein [Desulfobulbaceae bacterium]
MSISTDTTTNTKRQDDVAGKPLIELSEIRFSWPGGTLPVLEIDHFHLGHDESIFIRGPSGSGKSTLLGIITGILLPQDGDVVVVDRRINDLSGAERDRFRVDTMGYIFQMFNLIPYLNIVENVILPCQFSKSRKAQALRNSSTLEEEALRLLSHLNLGGSEVQDKVVAELSVGQQQRVAAARALIGGPRLVIGDEPTSSLDSEHRESFLRLLFEECSRMGSSLIFVSHDIDLAPMFDRVVELSEINNAPDGTAGGKE